jgi:eukaryotic-like serine/threonine-protein kinase
MTATTTTPSPEPDLSGYVLDRYRLVRCLGIGGMGAVYEAEHTTLGKRVAVKLLRQQIAMQEIARKRFLREARAATRVEHPHVVDISDFGETAEARVYFVMELLAGRDLGELLEAEGRLPWARAQELLGQIVSALAAAHAKGIVHRDMKPSNCFLVDVPGLEGRDFVKVLDFGIAKLSGKHEETQGLTSTDEVFGTVGYMAPEMAMGISDDPRSDVYAVGVMMYRMLVGELPFQGGTAFQILARHVGERPISPRAKDPSIPAGAERIILQAMAKRPEERFASMQALGDAIRRGDVDAAGVSPGATVAATLRMDAASSLSRVPIERTAFLVVAGLDTGPRPSVGSTPPSTTLGVHDSRRLSLAMDEAEAARDEDEPDALEPDAGVGKHRILLVAGILLGMASVLAVVAAVVSRPGGANADPVAITPARAEPAAEPAAAPEPAVAPALDLGLEPGPPRPSPAPEPTVEAPVARAEPSPVAEGPQPQPVSQAPGRRGMPRTDAFVATRIQQKLRARCRLDGRTTVKVEGIIATSGKVFSPLVSPMHGPGSCVREIVKTSRFARGEQLRPMPVILVSL